MLDSLTLFKADRNSKIKFLSLTASKPFSKTLITPSCIATNSLSIGKEGPVKAAELRVKHQSSHINLVSSPYPVQSYKNKPSSAEKKG